MSCAWGFGLACLAATLFLLSGGVVAEARAQTPPGRLPFLTYGAEWGFGPWGVYALAQDSDGYLWVGTDHGAYRFDGHRFVPVRPPNDSQYKYVSQLVSGAQGRMYSLNVNELLRFRHGKPEAGAVLPLGDVPRLGLAVDGGGRAWVITHGELLREDDGGFRPVAEAPDGLLTAVHSTPRAVHLATPTALHRFSPPAPARAFDLSQHFPDGFELLGADGQGRPWVIARERVFRLGLEPLVVDEIPIPPGVQQIIHLAGAPDGTTWLGTSGSLLTLAGDAAAVDFVRSNPSPEVRALLVDHEGSLWVGGVGLHRLTGRGLWQVYDEREGLPNRTIWPIDRDAEGRLWVATNEGLARATATGFVREAAVPAVVIKTFTMGPDGALWLGGHGLEVFRYDPAQGTLDRIPIPRAPVRMLRFDPEGTLWAATAKGLFRGTGEGAALTFEDNPVEGTPETMVMDIVLDRAGRLWFATHKGLFVLEGGRLHRLPDEGGLLPVAKAYLVVRRNGELCMAYHLTAGVDCFRYENGAIRDLVRIDATRGLSSDSVYLLDEDRQGRLWIGSGRGVDIVVDHRVVDHFGVEDGLPGDDCNEHSFYAEENGDIWLGTSTGLGRFASVRYSGPLPPPSARLSAARLGDVDLLSLGDRFSVPYQKSALEFEVAVPSYVARSRIEREVRLHHGAAFQPLVDPTTRYLDLPPGDYQVEVRARRQHGAFGPPARLSFVLLPPFWATLWFRSLVGLGLVVLTWAFMRWRQQALRRRNMELDELVSCRTRELEQAQARIVALERDTTEQQMAGGFAHEMRNALAALKITLARAQREGGGTLCDDTSDKLREAFLEVRDRVSPEVRARLVRLLRELGANEAQLDGVLRDSNALADRGLSITGQILEYSRIGKEQPGRDPVRLRPLVEAIIEESRLELGERGIEVIIAIDPSAEVLSREAHIYSMVKNLILNACDALLEKGGEGPRRLSIELRDAEGSSSLLVEDSGVGIPEEHLTRIFEPFFTTKPQEGTGLGLGVVRKLANLYGFTLNVESEVGKGTRVWVGFGRVGVEGNL